MPVMPGAVWRPVPSHGGTMTAHLGLVLHVQVGNGSCYGEFSVPANQASSTWWVAKNGLIEQYVDSDVAAWTEAAGNSTWDSVETEGTPDEALTAAQVASVARIYAWGAQTYGWPFVLSDDPNTRGFGWHGMGGAAWGGHTGCPGDLRKAQRPAILAAAQSNTGGLHMDADVQAAFGAVRTDIGSTKTDVDRVSADVTSLHQKVDKILAALAAGTGSGPSHFTGTVDIKAAQ